MMTSIPSINVGKDPDPEDDSEINSKVKKMKPHVPGIVTFADHNRPLPWTVTYHAVVMFADISGFTALCEKYSGMGQSGVDQLTRTLNEYLSALVEGILGSDGDILKFAGDAILAIWRVGRIEELPSELSKVVGCCLDIQDMCGEWNTDIGVKLTVKIGVSAGEMSVTFLGNQEYRHYVELGPAVTAVNTAEAFCQSGYVVMSPGAWDIARQDWYETELLEDNQHVRVLALRPGQRTRSASLPTPCLHDSLHADKSLQFQRKSLEEPPSRSELPKLGTITSTVVIEVSSDPVTTAAVEKPKQMKGLISNKMKIGQKFGKLRKVVETVTEMRLDIALRLYILIPVLKKLDDDQPLEYLSEMRQTSIVFMNLVLDDKKDTANLLQKIFELVYTQTKLMHGCLNKVFLFDKGCTFLIIFGLPGYKHEQDSAHALLSSGRMKTRLDTIAGVKRVSIGVTTGTTFCGVVGHPNRHEYSVIGRKVNMAARLMMHYPNKVTCGNETYQTCRLPSAHFAILETKQMKGLTNVGIIREFLEQSKEDTLIPQSIKHSDYPLLGRQVEEFTFREQLTQMKKEEPRKHLVFSGAAGIGKTKLLDHMVDIAEDQRYRVISCCVQLHDSSIPYFIAGHILRSLLNNCGVESDAEQEQYVMEQVSEETAQYLYLLNDVVGFGFEKPARLSQKTFNEKTKRRELLRTVSKMCLMKGSETVIVIDDAQNIDSASWEYMCELSSIKEALIVLGLRPSIIEKPSCKEVFQFIESSEVRLIDLGSLDLKFMSPLACQMMDVVSLPKDLDKILRERSHGVPSWCLEILKDILDKKQLIVVHDDGRPDFRQSAVIPNKLLIKPVRSGNLLKPPSHTILKVSVTDIPSETRTTENSEENSILESLGFIHEPTSSVMFNRRKASVAYASTAASRAIKGLHVPAFIDDSVKKVEQLEVPELERIAIFAKGISAKDIPVPRSMKELIIARLDSMRASDQLLVKCAAILGMNIRKDILEMLLPKAHRPKMNRNIRRVIESGIFVCGKTPSSHCAQLTGGRDETASIKYRCYCPKEDVVARVGEIQVCSSPKFMNSLLQQTAYECLLETQRIELHAKAARYFEILADEFRSNIPYYLLSRPPPDYLQEALEKSKAFDIFTTPKKTKRNQVEDDPFTEQAEWSRARRGRRQAVFVAAEDASPLVDRIVEKAKPLEVVEHHIENLLPIYDSLVYHWKCAGKSSNILSTLLEATAAAIATKRNAKAFELLKEANLLMEEQGVCAENEDESTVFRAKLFRLHGKILFQAGQISEAYAYLSKAGNLLGLKQPSTRAKMRIFMAKLLARFFLYWKFNVNRNEPASFRILEQGYCLRDLYMMDRERGDTQLKFIHALQQFTKVAGRTIHLHQIITAYSSMIECCRERRWFDISDKLEAELLRGCAARHDELSTEDRSMLGGIYTRSFIAFFLKGDLNNAEKSGRAAAEICICIQDLETTKIFTPYYFFLCLMRSTYENCIDMLHQYKFSSQMTDDKIARAIYHSLCLEVALAGGCPPDTPQTCLAYVAKYLRTCDAVASEITTRYYIAMTAALWCARKQRWTEIQTWFDYWEMYETSDHSFFSLLARANKVECMLHSLSKCIEIGNTSIAKKLKQHIEEDLKWCIRTAHKTPVLRPRFFHLRAYSAILNGNVAAAKSTVGEAVVITCKQDNKHEEKWMSHNISIWCRDKHDTKCNEVWLEHTDSHYLDWQLKSGLRNEMNMYTLPLPYGR